MHLPPFPRQVTVIVRRCPFAAMTASLATASLLGCSTPSAAPGSNSTTGREEIYVLSSVREERAPKPGWCSPERAGFTPYTGDVDRFAFWSLQIQPGDGRVSDARSNMAAVGLACFGPTADPAVINFYAEGQVAGMSYTGRGDCRVVRVDFPEKGISVHRCALDLRGLPSPYVGGLLTSNTVSSKALLGEETEPPGYLQSSIATIRLWRSQ